MSKQFGYTPAGGYISYPPYLNIKRVGEDVVFTVRGSESPRDEGGHWCGVAADISVPLDEAKAILSNALEGL